MTIRDRVGATATHVNNPHNDGRLWFSVTYTAVNGELPTLPLYDFGGTGLSSGFVENDGGGVWECFNSNDDMKCTVPTPNNVGSGQSTTVVLSFAASPCLAAGTCPTEFNFGPPVPANYTLSAVTSISGTVTAASNGSPVTGACVTATPISGTAPNQVVDPNRATLFACSDVNGHYVINGLVAATKYVLRAVPPSGPLAPMYLGGGSSLAGATSVLPGSSTSDFALIVRVMSAPVALPDTVSTGAGVAKDISVLANDLRC